MDEQRHARPRILVVDDRKENTVILQNFLAPKGYDVTAVFTGEEAMRLSKTTPAAALAKAAESEKCIQVVKNLEVVDPAVRTSVEALRELRGCVDGDQHGAGGSWAAGGGGGSHPGGDRPASTVCAILEQPCRGLAWAGEDRRSG